MKTFGDLLGFKKKLETDALEKAESLRREKELAAQRAREANVFRKEMHDAVLLPPSNRLSMAPKPPAPYPFQTELDEQAALAASMSDEINIESLLDTDSNLSFRRDHISPQVVRKLRKGHWSVKAQLDLHGFRTDEARDCLVQFLNTCQKNDWRCVRVIHGKGLGSPDREPVLKGKVLRWLVQRDEILAFCQARPNDGGSGALIVLLKAA
jgi:DNA-nicking Smr family endonuclease